MGTDYVPIRFSEWCAQQEIPLRKDCPECEGDSALTGLCSGCWERHHAAYRMQVEVDRERWNAAMAAEGSD